MVTLVLVESTLSKEHNARDLGEIETIIGWQLTQNLGMGLTKIDQSAYIKDLLEEVALADCDIPMIAGAKTDMGEPDEEADLRLY